MPELPEVESVRRQLAPVLSGRRVTSVWWDAHPAARLSDVHLLEGRRVRRVERRGKFLVCPLDAGPDGTSLELVLHLGMTGSLRLLDDRTPEARPTGNPISGPRPPDAGPTRANPPGTIPSDAVPPETAPGLPRHVRASFVLDDDRVLLFNDPRRFGRVSVVAAGDYAGRIPTLAAMGPEPLSEDFRMAAFAAALARSSATVKAQLLSQRLVAGLGNIYVDEALWRAGIHPASRRVGRRRARLLHTAIREVLVEAIEREGTTFRDYRMVNGQSGRNAAFLQAYGRGDLPCARCGTPLRRTLVAQRGTTYCPHCQRH